MTYNIIDAGREDLVAGEFKSAEYVEGSETAWAASSNIAAAISAMPAGKTTSDAATVAQALFDSNFITEHESDFQIGALIEKIYAVKVRKGMDQYFTPLHDALMDGEYWDHEDNSFNTSGDNYFSAYQFQKEFSELDIKLNASADKMLAGLYKAGVTRAKPSNEPRPDRKAHPDACRKVIIVENQSQKFAYVLDHSINTGKPTTFSIYMLQNENDIEDDQDRTSVMIDAEFDIAATGSWKYAAENNWFTVATLTINEMVCKNVDLPKRIELTLGNLNNGFCYLDEIREGQK